MYIKRSATNFEGRKGMISRSPHRSTCFSNYNVTETEEAVFPIAFHSLSIPCSKSINQPNVQTSYAILKSQTCQSFQARKYAYKLSPQPGILSKIQSMQMLFSEQYQKPHRWLSLKFWAILVLATLVMLVTLAMLTTARPTTHTYVRPSSGDSRGAKHLHPTSKNPSLPSAVQTHVIPDSFTSLLFLISS